MVISILRQKTLISALFLQSFKPLRLSFFSYADFLQSVQLQHRATAAVSNQPPGPGLQSLHALRPASLLHRHRPSHRRDHSHESRNSLRQVPTPPSTTPLHPPTLRPIERAPIFSSTFPLPLFAFSFPSFIVNFYLFFLKQKSHIKWCRERVFQHFWSSQWRREKIYSCLGSGFASSETATFPRAGSAWSYSEVAPDFGWQCVFFFFKLVVLPW